MHASYSEAQRAEEAGFQVTPALSSIRQLGVTHRMYVLPDPVGQCDWSVLDGTMILFPLGSLRNTF